MERHWFSENSVAGFDVGCRRAAVLAAGAIPLRYYVDRRIGQLTEIARAQEEQERIAGQAVREADFRARLQTAESKHQDRTITNAQEKAIVEALKPVLSGKRIIVHTDNRTKEAGRFAVRIESVMHAAGVIVNTQNGIPPGNSSIAVRIESAQYRKSEADAIASAFIAAKVFDDAPWSLAPDPAGDPDALTVFVGAMP